MDKVLYSYSKSHPQRYDLFKHMCAVESFLIDFDSLVMMALSNQATDWTRTQTLHIAFNIEAFLMNLKVRGAVFSIVCFECNAWMWSTDPQKRLVREALWAHLSGPHCPKVEMKTFQNWWEDGKNGFGQYCARIQPEFVLLADGESIPPLASDNDNDLLATAQHQFRTQAISAIITQGLMIVFSSRVVFKDSSAVGFVWRDAKGIDAEILAQAIGIVKAGIIPTPTLQTGPPTTETSTFRARVATAAVRDVVKVPGASLPLAKAFLLHVALLETLPLDSRAYALCEGSLLAVAFFTKVCGAACPYVTGAAADATTPDLFDGRLFVKIVQSGSSFTPDAATTARLASLWAAAAGGGPVGAMDGGPVGPMEVIEDPNAGPDSSLDDVPEDFDASPISSWIPKSKILEQLDAVYCGHEIDFGKKRENFFNKVHADASTLGERPYVLQGMSKDKVTIKANERAIMLANSSGRAKQETDKRRTRLTTLRAEFGNKPFAQGYSVLMDFITDTQFEGRKFETEMVRIPDGVDVKTLVQTTSLAFYQLIMEAYHFLLTDKAGAFVQWEAEVDAAAASGRQPNKTIAAIPFTLIHKAREVLESAAKHISTDEAKKQTKKWTRDLRDLLSTLGLRDNVRLWDDLWKANNVPLAVPSVYIPEKDTMSVGMSAVRFQMTVMGDHLERPRAEPEEIPRVPFTPDEWQRELLDIVDRRESVLVCTPTSAGKTFVSFYCIKEALISNADPPGLIVYVCPTKALLRQSLASIYAKFMGKKYDSAWNVYGVLEDYAFMLERCQALVTIPEAFEALLLSPRLDHQILMQRVTYVIFDEIHSIDDLRTGCVWERLLVLIRAPFIALSATVGNPHDLSGWLQSVATISKQQQETRTKKPALEGRFKVNSLPRPGKKIHRWSDLQKYAFRPVRHCAPKEGRTKVYDHRGMLDATYHADGLIDLHPMSVLTLRKLMEDGEFPQDLPFLPKEMLELYDAMRKHCSKKRTPAAYTAIQDVLEPNVFFKRNQSPLVTQTSAREYEAALVTEFMSWVSDAKTGNKELRDLANAVLSELGAGTSFVLPRSGLRLYNAMAEAHETILDGAEDSMLEVGLYPPTYFRNAQEPSPEQTQLHQYLLVSMLLSWERAGGIDNSSKHTDMVRHVLRTFEVSMADHLPSPLGDLVVQVRADRLPHYSVKTSAKRSVIPHKAVLGLPADVATLYTQISAASPDPNRCLDELLPENFFGPLGKKSTEDIATLAQYKMLLLAEYARGDPKSSVDITASHSEVLSILKQDYVLAHLSPDISPADESFLRMPLKKSSIATPYKIEYAQEFLYELLVTLNTRDMMPAIIFNFDITMVEKLAFELTEQLETNEQKFRHSEEFQAMIQRIEDLKKQVAALEKTKAGKSRKGNKDGNDEEGGEGGRGNKGDNRVDKDEFHDLQGMLVDIPAILPYFSFARRGAGEGSDKVQQLIAEYVKYPTELDRKYIKCIQRGIGLHHTGMSSKMAALMEHLFRTHNLGVMVSTTTLALGVHSPCRSVVIAGDDTQLTNVQFRQMAGRAGRRGLDFLGHVIMLGVRSKKIARLLTSKLQCLRGHTIVDPTTSLQTRLQHQSVALQSDAATALKKRKTKYYTDAYLAEAPILVQEDQDRLHMTSFLSKCYSRAGDTVDTEQRVMWQRFTLTFLEKEGYVSTEQSFLAKTQCELLARGLHAYGNVRMNGLNYTFLALLRQGVLHEIAKDYTDNERQLLSGDPEGKGGDFTLNSTMLAVLATFMQSDEFGLPLEQHPSIVTLGVEADKGHAVVMPSLPPKAKEALRLYSQRVLRHYTAFVVEVTKKLPPGARSRLPYSDIDVEKRGSSSVSLPDTFATPAIARSPFVGMSGRRDVFSCVDDLVGSISPLLQVDPATIPVVDFVDFVKGPRAHILLNACSYDFVRNGTQKLFGHFERAYLRDLNGMNLDDSWNTLQRFRSAVMNTTSLSQYLAPACHSADGVHDQDGVIFHCSNPACQTFRKEDYDTYPGVRVIRGMVFKCHECVDPVAYLCQGCAFDNDVKCKKGPEHEFGPYVEDDFVCSMEHTALMLGHRKQERAVDGWKEDVWQRLYAKKYASGLTYVAVPRKQQGDG